jgi:tRNA (guanine26-N2/guanine27-N2)-dimethyltransferase
MIYDEKEAVFYNKVQVLNRDLSIQTIKLFSEVITEERHNKYEAKRAKYEANPTASDRPPFAPSKGITVLDALAATGLRSVRYLKEIPKLEHITINDLLAEATTAAMVNIKTNGIDPEKVIVNNGDACMLMYQHRDPTLNYDVIDLDPYGSAAPFLDSAVQAVAGDGGLLCVTCTDSPVLSGNYPEVCYSKYGSMPLKAKYLHEMALRILLNSIETAANKYKRYIVPWLSLSVDFYVRVFARVYESPAEVKNTCLKRIMTYQSTQCSSFINQTVGTRNRSKKDKMEETKRNKAAAGGEGEEAADAPSNQPSSNAGNSGNYGASSLEVPAVCEESGGRWKVGGPFWGAPIHDQRMVDTILARVDLARAAQAKGSKTAPAGEERDDAAGEASAPALMAIPTAERLAGMLTSISEELKDVPFYYSLPDLASTLQCTVPTHLEFKSALINAGYRVSHFHHDPSAFKTDAPNSVVSSEQCGVNRHT